MAKGLKLLPEWDWGVDVKGVDDPELAQILAQDTIEMLHLLSESGFDLRTLDGVTIATDYSKALSEIDRGLKFQNTVKPTSENGVEGVAMALGVMRQGHQRTHLVLTAWIPLLLRGEQEEQKCQAFGMIAHEAAHIHFAAKLDSRISNTFGHAPSLDDYPAAFQIAAMHIWDEYAATRMSGYINPDAAKGYQENIKTLVTAMEPFRIERVIAYALPLRVRRLHPIELVVSRQTIVASDYGRCRPPITQALCVENATLQVSFLSDARPDSPV